MTGQSIRRGLALGAATMMAVSAPARAEMGCWAPIQVAAAKVRNLQSRLMVTTLRCQAIGVDVSGAYNRFLAPNRLTIQAANAVLLAHFRAGFGGAGQTHFDRFAIALANIDREHAPSALVCAETAALAEEAAAAAGDVEQLVALADRLGFAVPLPGGQCARGVSGGN